MLQYEKLHYNVHNVTEQRHIYMSYNWLFTFIKCILLIPYELQIRPSHRNSRGDRYRDIAARYSALRQKALQRFI